MGEIYVFFDDSDMRGFFTTKEKAISWIREDIENTNPNEFF